LRLHNREQTVLQLSTVMLFYKLGLYESVASFPGLTAIWKKIHTVENKNGALTFLKNISVYCFRLTTSIVY